MVIMPAPKFPLSPAQSVGRFWNAETPDTTATGTCKVSDDGSEIDIFGQLSPSHSTSSTPHTLTPRAIDEAVDFDIHGDLPVAPGSVTFTGCHTIRRRSLGVFNSARQHQVIGADWCIAGAHVRADTRYTGVRLRVSYLEEWARTPGLEQTHQFDPTVVAITWSPPDSATAPFNEFDQNATVETHTVATVSPIDFHGGGIQTANWLSLAGLNGWTLEEAVARFVIPTQLLMSLLSGRRARITHLEVSTTAEGTAHDAGAPDAAGTTEKFPAEVPNSTSKVTNVTGESGAGEHEGARPRWLQVYGHVVETNYDAPAADLLLGLDTFNLEHFARWCTMTTDLSPVPHVLSAATAGEFLTVETEAISLATAAEGLHRLLHPEQERFTDDDIAAAIEGVEAATIPVEVKMSLTSALGQYWGEPSHPQRMEALAERVADAAPGCVGRINRWKSQVTSQRVALAHGLASEDNDDAITQTHALTRSLHWALTIRLLQQAGVPDAELATALDESTAYQRDQRMWTTAWPKIFAPA